MDAFTFDHAAVIRDLVTSPDQFQQRPEVRDPAFFQSFLRYCIGEIFSDPTRGLAHVAIAEKIAETSCQQVQVIGITAICYRALGRPEKGAELIQDAWPLARECSSCLPDLLRRRAFIRRDLSLYVEAIDDATEAIELYRALPDAGHDLDGNGLASAILCRGQIRFEIARANTATGPSSALLSAAVADISEALSRMSPTGSPKLYRVAVYNLAVALAATGQRRDLLLADQHLRVARRLFKGTSRRSLERAKLDWLTAMIRHELGSMKLHRVRAYLGRARDIFIEQGVLQEGLAVTADLARIAFPDRRKIRDLVESDFIRDLVPRLRAEVQNAWARLETSLDVRGWHGQDSTKLAIAGLRDACGPRMLSCLVSWHQ